MVGIMWWSWVLGIIGVAGIFFVGRKTIWGWFVLLFNECLWITYALITNQYGFIFSALATEVPPNFNTFIVCVLF